MATLSKDALFEKVQSAIETCGWQITGNPQVTENPFRLEISKGEEKLTLLIYIWNLSHGGASRPENEYRIQVKVSKFEELSDTKTLILGYWDEKNVFAGFDVSKHYGTPGWSASMQIKKEYLEDAAVNKVSAYAKDNGEIAIAFAPSFFMTYVDDLEELHNEGDLDKYLLPPVEDKREIEDNTELETIPYRFSISSYGADYPIDGLIRRIDDKSIYVPRFQRNFVWNVKEASRFIESLLLGLPVPGIFLSRDNDSAMMIIDGQQRLISIYSFYKNNFKGKPFKLQEVNEEFIGKTYAELDLQDRRRLDDFIIHATIVKQEKPNDDDSSIYMIFERLNTGGRLLSPQEIRDCVYYGSFSEYLNSLTFDRTWRSFFTKKNERRKEQEILLRFFALYFDFANYQKPLKKFLNNFMESNKEMQKVSEAEMNAVLVPALTFIHSTLGSSAFRLTKGTPINAAVFDSVMFAVARRNSDNNPITDQTEFKKAYNDLIQNREFVSSTKDATSDVTTVTRRIALAVEQFKNLK
ncbi:MAG TPA: DUF262 domain-containing protein [Chitinophagales bacterium]|nr:DUF262 domain-containing protein [Chitinophagales bacterium]